MKDSISEPPRLFPRISPENFRAPFIAAEGWGTFTQTIDKGGLQAKLQVKNGTLAIQTIRLTPVGIHVEKVEVSCNGKKLDTVLEKHSDGVVGKLKNQLRIREALVIELTLIFPLLATEQGWVREGRDSEEQVKPNG